MTNHHIHWPALIQHTGDVELELLVDAQAFATWQASGTQARMIDVSGQVFALGPDKQPVAAGRASLEEILALVRQHALLEGVCCTSKLGAADIPAAFIILASLVQA